MNNKKTRQSAVLIFTFISLKANAIQIDCYGEAHIGSESNGSSLIHVQIEESRRDEAGRGIIEYDFNSYLNRYQKKVSVGKAWFLPSQKTDLPFEVFVSNSLPGLTLSMIFYSRHQAVGVLSDQDPQLSINGRGAEARLDPELRLSCTTRFDIVKYENDHE